MKLRLTWVWTVGILLAFALAWKPAGAALAKEPPPAVYLVRGDTIFLWITASVPRSWGVEIFRKDPGAPDFRKLTAQPLRAVRTPEEVQRGLGSLYPWVARALEADNAFQVLRRLRSSTFRGQLLSLLDRRVGQVLGRFYADTTAGGPGPFRYRLILVDRRAKPGRTFELTVRKEERLLLAPRNLKAEPGDGRVTLRWEYPAWRGDLQDLAIQFRVYRKAPGETHFQQVNRRLILRQQKEAATFTDLWLKNGSRYRYYVVAVDPLGREGPPSQRVTVTPKDNVAPAVPQGLAAETESTTVHLAWAPNVELDLMGYRVYRAPSLRGPFRPISPLLPADRPYFDDVGVSPGQLFFYRVSALDSSGNESEKSNALSVVVRDRWPPEPPSRVWAEVDTSGLLVRWEPSPSRDVRGYYVYLGELERQLPRLTTKALPESASRYRVPKNQLVPGRTYWLAVTALDYANNESPQQRVRVDVPDWAAPRPPAFLNARVQPDGSVRLTWGASPSLDAVGYRVYRNDSLLVRLPRNTHTYVDRAVRQGRTYRYAVAAVDSAGNESTPRQAQTFARDFTPPPAPRDLRARLTPQGVELTWGRVIAKDLAGFYVYRSDLPTGTFQRLNREPLTEQHFVDPQGTAQHWYKVRAVDTSGNESAWKGAVRPK